MPSYSRIEEVMAWQFAAHLASRLTDGMVVNWLFEGGHYNVLEVRAPGTSIPINRPGSMHFFETPRGGLPSIPSERWHEQVLETDGLRNLVKHVAEMGGLRLLAVPRTDPEALQWQVTARLLTSRLFERLPWTCQMDYHQDAGNMRRIWLLRKGDVVIGELEHGEVRASSGAQVTLADEYLKGKTIDELVAMVTRLTKP